MIKKLVSNAIKKVNKETGTIRFRLTDKSMDRDGEVVLPGKMKLDSFKSNPVFLWLHGFDNRGLLPIGKILPETIEQTDEFIDADVKFRIEKDDKGAKDEFATQIFDMYADGYLNAGSVGFRGKYSRDNKDRIFPDQEGGTWIESELMEFSGVPIPANANALMQKSWGNIIKNSAGKEIKSVIPFKSFPLAPESDEWDGAKEIAAADVDALKIMATWYDRENADIKSSFKLPHHRQSDKYTVWRGVSAAMAALLGARGGVDIPDADREGVYNHLAKHYKEFDKEAPEFKSIEQIEAEKSGRVLSDKNRSLVQKAVEALTELLAASEPPETTESFNEFNEKLINAIAKKLS